MKYQHNKPVKQSWLTWKKVVLIGLAVGIPLAVGVYIFLYAQGQQILAEDYAREYERQAEWQAWKKYTSN